MSKSEPRNEMDLYDLCAKRMSPDDFRRQLAKHSPEEWDDIWNVRDEDTYTAFHVACRSQTDIGVFQAIFEHVKDADRLWKHKSGFFKQTPLHFLCEQRIATNNISSSVVQYLLKEAGGSKYWTVRDAEGWTPLHYAMDPGFGTESHITKTMFEVCIRNGGSAALFVRESNYGYAPIWGAMDKQDMDWLKLAMKLGGTKELLRHKDPMQILSPAFKKLLIRTTKEKEIIQFFQKELASGFLEKVGDMPHTKEYLDGVGMSLQDLPKHVIEDKIIPKIGGANNYNLEDYYESARLAASIGGRFRSHENFMRIMNTNIHPLLMQSYRHEHPIDNQTKVLIGVIMQVVFAVEDTLYSAKSLDLYDALHIVLRKDMSQKLKKWMPWLVPVIPVNPIIRFASLLLLRFVGQELQDQINFDLLKHVATFASSMKSYGKLISKEHINNKDKTGIRPPLHVLICMVLYCIKPAGINLIMTSIHQTIDVYLFDKKPPCGSFLCEFARSHCKVAPCGHAIQSFSVSSPKSTTKTNTLTWATASSASSPKGMMTRAKTKAAQAKKSKK